MEFGVSEPMMQAEAVAVVSAVLTYRRVQKDGSANCARCDSGQRLKQRFHLRHTVQILDIDMRERLSFVVNSSRSPAGWV